MNNRLTCKLCDSPYIVRDGKLKGIQRWECRTCGKKFLENGTPPGGRTPIEQISSAARLYYGGLRLSAICREFQKQYNTYPSVSSVYRWAIKCARNIGAKSRDIIPKVGDKWIVNETLLYINGKQVWMWDVIDIKTQFLLASTVTLRHDELDAKFLMKVAIEKANQPPRAVITNKLTKYLKGRYIDYYDNTEKCSKKACLKIDSRSSRYITKFQDVFKKRTNSISTLKSLKRAVEFKNGWMAHYNYFEPNEHLNGKIPAEIAQVKFPTQNNTDVINNGVISNTGIYN